MADLKTEIYLAIKDFCKNNDSAEWAACTATRLVEEKFTSTNSDYAAALLDLKMFIHGRLQVHPELQCELGFIWERLNALKAEHFA